MSRSYKKFAGYSDYSRGRTGTKLSKRIANKRVRHTKNVANGCGFKKVSCSYDIRDWKYIYFYESDYNWMNDIFSEEEVLRKKWKAKSK